MKTRIANVLRGLANRLDPVPDTLPPSLWMTSQNTGGFANCLFTGVTYWNGQRFIDGRPA